MPNFNNWRNWGTNILIRLGLQDQHYAHAFATVDPVYEKEEEEVDLSATVFAWGWFRRAVRSVARVFKPVVKTVKKVFKPVVKTVGKVVSAVGRGVKDVVTKPVQSISNVLTFGGVDREMDKAKKEAAAAQSMHQQSVDEYKAGEAKNKAELDAARAKYSAQKTASSKSAAESQSKLDKATAYRAEAKATGERTYAAQRNVSKQGEFLASQTLRKAQEESAKRKQVKESKGSGPGYTGVTIKPGSALPTGKVRSKSKSKKELVEKSKSGGLGGL
tara:strand:+ start:174 stop:995 length:822 start_codon:yes stop_codon:yes gene_type:complete